MKILVFYLNIIITFLFSIPYILLLLIGTIYRLLYKYTISYMLSLLYKNNTFKIPQWFIRYEDICKQLINFK